ncbi:MAG TPA: hypothetical protein VG963_06180, partial [Polyangiaceae bacterium]|nr:hypothetical protein [Polyangiaceae bacterium]
ASARRHVSGPTQLGEHPAVAAKAALKAQPVPATHVKAATPPTRAPRKKPAASDSKTDSSEFDFGI